MTTISKSKFMNLYRCSKYAWLCEHLPEEVAENTKAEDRIESGKQIGILARSLFENPVDVTVKNCNGLDLSEMIERTKEEMKKGTDVICEASFSVDNLFCSIDVLKRNDDGWDIYEVKSVTVNSLNSSINHYAVDVAFQKYVLEKCGLKIVNAYLVCIDSDYVRGQKLELEELFAVIDLNEKVASMETEIEECLAIASDIFVMPSEPTVSLSSSCSLMAKKDCPYWNYCTKDLVAPNVFDLYRIKFSDAIKYYQAGIISFDDFISSGKIKNEKQLRQIDYYLNDKGTYTDKEEIKKFLDEIIYPMYFLDFESIQLAIPEYEGTKPYMQLVTQYSIHYIEYEGGPLLHKEYLAESGFDPRRGVAENLCKDIPEKCSVIVYNKNFESTRLREMADVFPDLADKLLAIKNNIVDLLVPFQKGWYYKREMGGSFSIKVVLPAIFPSDPDLDYHKLEDVHNGTEAMDLWPKLQYMDAEERERLEKNLLKYCELDTYAMVKIWEELKSVVIR